MSTLKSSAEHLILNADGASSEVRIQQNGTTAITIDSSENVGIGVVPENWHSTYKAIQLGGTGSIIAHGAAAAAGQTMQIGQNTYLDSGGHKYQATDEASRYYQNDGIHYFQVAPSGSADSAISWTSAMTIDNSGRVTMPSQPAFSQAGTATYTFSSTGGLDFTSSNVWSSSASTLSNVGSHFNVSTGRFTAPVDGSYLFTLSCAAQYSSGYFYLYILKNNAGVTGGSRNYSQSSTNEMQTINFILDMNANDYVTAHTVSNYSGAVIYAPSFSGYLIG